MLRAPQVVPSPSAMGYYLRILSYGRQWYGNLVGALFVLILFNVFSAASLTLFIPFLEILFSEAKDAPAAPPAVIERIEDLKALGYHALYKTMETLGRHTALLYFCVAVGVAIFLKNIFRYAGAYLMAPLEYGIVENLRNRLFDHLTRLSLGYYTRQRRGHLVNVNMSDMSNVHEAVVGTLLPLINDPLTMLVFLISMLALSWKLTIFTLVVLPLTALVIGRISASLKRKVERGQTTLDNLISVLDEFLGGIRIVKAFGAEGYTYGRFAALNRNYTHHMTRFRQQIDLVSPLTEFLAILVILSIILYGGMLIIRGEGDLKASEFITFIVFFSQFISPTKTLSHALARVQKARVSYGRIEVILQTPIQSTEASGGLPVSGIEKQIELRRVGFAYENGKPVLQDVSLTISKGETVALVGPSGGGKSTLLDLICRFYDPQEGGIYLDGKDFRTLDATQLRKLMGIVSQEGILFNDTVRGNIAYGDPSYTLEQVQEAARIANADSFIEQLPEGYDTMIGERGLTLSGGQRQRLSIARAILRNPPILVLDEATSALDSESERLVQTALERLMEGRTSIVVAHRLSTIVRADRIVVINAGRVEDVGNHEELLARGGKYRELYELQFKSPEVVVQD